MATNHLFRRSAIYWWRARLPKPIASLIGRTHLARSLHTSQPDKARRLARRLSAVVEELAATVKGDMMAGNPPTKADLDRILMDLFTEVLETGELNRTARHPGFSPWTVDGDASEEEQMLAEEDYPERRVELWRDWLASNRLDPVQDWVRDKLAERNLAPPATPLEWRGFLRKAMGTLEAAYTIDAERERGMYRPPFHPFVSVSGVPASEMTQAGTEAAKMLLSGAAVEHIAKQMGEGLWKKDSETPDQMRLAVRLFVAFKGDLPYAQIVKADAHAFRTWLCGLPSLFGRSIYTGLEPAKAIDLREAVEKALDANKRAKTIRVGSAEVPRDKAAQYARKLSKTTVNRHIIMLVGIYNGKSQRGAFTGQNPFAGTAFPEKVRKKDAKSRKNWSAENLQALFNLPAWTGAENRSGRTTRGSLVFDDGRFWVPLIALFTGAREDEIASLALDDLIFDKGAECWVFDIKEGKTHNAPRKVPVHPELEKIGIIDYQAAVRTAGHDHLFPELHGRYRDPGEVISRFFTDVRKAGAIYEEWMDFHSFRRTFKTRLYQELHAHPVMVKQLLGHAQDEMDEAYFGGFEPKHTAPLLRALSFAPLDLSHLHRAQQPTRAFHEPPPLQKARTRVKPGNAAPEASATDTAKPPRKSRKRVLVPPKAKLLADTG